MKARNNLTYFFCDAGIELYKPFEYKISSIGVIGPRPMRESNCESIGFVKQLNTQGESAIVPHRTLWS